MKVEHIIKCFKILPDGTEVPNGVIRSQIMLPDPPRILSRQRDALGRERMVFAGDIPSAGRPKDQVRLQRENYLTTPKEARRLALANYEGFANPYES